ncbi:hypothetical protein HW555_006990 [Spodoptera exigua]|uniref:Uncharacterized protein n=1 Tax=Spodoptera exigua TaxID=7107 RepID=A0A835L414_SPOEX|nr:hypothetical protein HW555_006990 [Spodoptera exigua]
MTSSAESKGLVGKWMCISIVNRIVFAGYPSLWNVLFGFWPITLYSFVVLRRLPDTTGIILNDSLTHALSRVRWQQQTDRGRIGSVATLENQRKSNIPCDHVLSHFFKYRRILFDCFWLQQYWIDRRPELFPYFAVTGNKILSFNDWEIIQTERFCGKKLCNCPIIGKDGGPGISFHDFKFVSELAVVLATAILLKTVVRDKDVSRSPVNNVGYQLATMFAGCAGRQRVRLCQYGPCCAGVRTLHDFVAKEIYLSSARLVKLATKESEEHVMDKNKSIDLNISTSTDIDEETDKRESPLPSGFENQLIKLNELLGDVFNEDDASTKENIEPTAPSSEKIQSTSSTTKNIEPTVSSAENIEPIASTSTHFEIIVDHEITPMPSPSSNEICDDTFCVGYAESENPPILTNDDLYGNLPTPSVTSFSSVYTPTAQSKQTRQPTFKRDKGKKRLIHKENWVTMFLNTISAGERIVTTSWKKYDGEMTVSDDKRGKYIHKTNVMDEEMIRSVCDHVKSFSLVESHYIRKDSKKLYLEDVKSASRMFNLYSEWFDSDKYRNKASTKRQYRDILNANFNIGFHKPKKDLCDVCHWTRLREVTVHALHYDRIEYKYNFEDEPKTIKILRSGNRNTERLSREFEIKQAYDGDLPISRNKYKDLINLCQTNIIPEKYHNFYQKLKFDQNVQEPLEDIDED